MAGDLETVEAVESQLRQAQAEGALALPAGYAMLPVGSFENQIEANRRNMNWLENVPLLITLFAVMELNGASRAWLHVLGATLLVGRLIHPFGISTEWTFRVPRFIGALATQLVTVSAAGTLLWQYFA